MKVLVTGSGLIGSEAVEHFVFVFLSTNKVYGDTPKEIPVKELEKRYDYARTQVSRRPGGSIKRYIHFSARRKQLLILSCGSFEAVA